MKKKIDPIHPGEILQEDFLTPMNISAYRLAKETYMDQTRVSEILKGKRSVTIDTALRLSKFFGTSPEFWVNIQTQYDMEVKEAELTEQLRKIKPVSKAG
jgi:addiction module HigA family antidote